MTPPAVLELANIEGGINIEKGFFFNAHPIFKGGCHMYSCYSAWDDKR